jgi:hypothetical protein
VPGPLVARWLAWSLDPPRAGALGGAHAEIENAGSAAWDNDIAVSYHWLDERGNAIVWDGVRTALSEVVAPGDRITVDIAVRAPMPPARYGFTLDLVAEHRAWFGELGGEPPTEAVDVRTRVDVEHLGDVATAHAPDGAQPSAEWEARVLELHAEGFAVVAGAIEPPRSGRKAFAPWTPGPGRIPGFSHPLLCPSVLDGIEVERLPDVEGLPAFRPPTDEPWVYDASLVLRVP